MEGCRCQLMTFNFEAGVQTFYRIDDITAALRLTMTSTVDVDDCSSDLPNPDSYSVILWVFNDVPDTKHFAGVNETCKSLMNECAKRRKRVVHLVKNFKLSGGAETLSLPRRALRMFHFHSLETATPDQLAAAVLRSQDHSSFSSPGESFAWQLVAGFLSYILPHFHTCVESSLLDDRASIRQDILSSYQCLNDVAAKQVLVLPRYFLLMWDKIACSDVSTDMTPKELFPGCHRVSSASSNLYLEFDSPGYKKRIPAYLFKLTEPLTSEQSKFSHLLVFAGYAAPLFVIQKLGISNQEKMKMLYDFSNELRFIVNHQSASRMLHEFSDSQSGEAAHLRPNSLKLIDVSDEKALETAILHEAADYLRSTDLASGTQSSHQPVSATPDDNLPLMSMAPAMAANAWVGFGMLLQTYIQGLGSAGQQIPFDLPYCFVLPTSGRYPDEAKLRKVFEELEVVSEQHQFQVPSGRRYTFRVHIWKSVRIAFEVPPSVQGIRKQAECGFGGVSVGDLSAHLAEFRDELAKFVCGGEAASFRVLEWDDVTGFRGDEWSEPSRQWAAALLDCCLRESADRASRPAALPSVSTSAGITAPTT